MKYEYLILCASNFLSLIIGITGGFFAGMIVGSQTLIDTILLMGLVIVLVGVITYIILKKI